MGVLGWVLLGVAVGGERALLGVVGVGWVLGVGGGSRSRTDGISYT